MFEVTLSKVRGGGNIRTDVTVGHCHRLPSIGESFEMFSESLTRDDGVRWITTSTVQNVINNTDHTLIETLNSTYKLVVE